MIGILKYPDEHNNIYQINLMNNLKSVLYIKCLCYRNTDIIILFSHYVKCFFFFYKMSVDFRKITI